MFASPQLVEAGPLFVPRTSVKMPIRASIDWQKDQVVIETVPTFPVKSNFSKMDAGMVAKAMELSFLELMQSLRIDSSTVVGTLIEEDPGLKNELISVFRQGQIDMLSLASRPMSCRVVIPLYTEVGLAKSLFFKMFPPDSTPKSGSKLLSGTFGKLEADQGYTGLIIDARKAGMFPCLFSEISTPTTRIYSYQRVDFLYALNFGLAGYSQSIEQAKKEARIGKNPLIIKATGVKGPFKGIAVVSEQDGQTLKKANAATGFLEKCKVVFVLSI